MFTNILAKERERERENSACNWHAGQPEYRYKKKSQSKYGTSLGFKPNSGLTLFGQMTAKHHVQGGVGKALMERIKSLVWSLNFNCPMCGGFLHNKQTYAQED